MIMIVCPVPSLLIVWAPHSLKMKVWWYNTVIGGLKLLWFQNMFNPPNKMTRGQKRGVSCQGGLSNQTSDRGFKPCCFCDFKIFHPLGYMARGHTTLLCHGGICHGGLSNQTSSSVNWRSAQFMVAASTDNEASWSKKRLGLKIHRKCHLNKDSITLCCCWPSSTVHWILKWLTQTAKHSSRNL